jgi:hypothetical protein
MNKVCLIMVLDNEQQTGKKIFAQTFQQDNWTGDEA